MNQSISKLTYSVNNGSSSSSSLKAIICAMSASYFLPSVWTIMQVIPVFLPLEGKTDATNAFYCRKVQT